MLQVKLEYLSLFFKKYYLLIVDSDNSPHGVRVGTRHFVLVAFEDPSQAKFRLPSSR